MKWVSRPGRLEFILAAYLCIPAALRVRSQAVSCEGSPGKKKRNWRCIINLSQFTLWWRVQSLIFCFSACVLCLPSGPDQPGPLDTGGRWSIRSGQKRKQHGSCQPHRAQKTEWPGPAGPTGRWLPQDNDQVTSAEWASHQANRLTLTHQGSQAACSQPPPPPANSLRLHPLTEKCYRSLLIY